ncbi:MAG: response regulator transcription factor [Desulfobulbaceae bacterium]|nr:response regulator transcription factor [Desulfobulbaceae bacterium]
MMKPYRIIVADDHGLIRQGIKSLILQDPALQVIAEAANGNDLLKLVRKRLPNMVIVDITMPQINGIEATAAIRKSFPKIAILVLTMHSHSQYFYQAIAAGAHGYLIKDDADTELLIAIKTIRDGNSYISPQLSTDVVEEIITAFRDEKALPLIVLRDREKQVLKHVVKGCSSRQIAEMLNLSARTVDHYRGKLLKKYKMKNTADLVSHVVMNALIISEK